MNNNMIFKIIGMAAAFLCCIAIGYLMPVEYFFGKDDAPVYGAGGGYAASGKIHTPAPVSTPKTVQPVETTDSCVSADVAPQRDGVPSDEVAAAEVRTEQPAGVEQPAGAEPLSGTKEPAAPDLAAPAVSTGDDLPEIAQALVYDRESKNYKKIGYRFIAKASAVSGDDLNYLLCGVGGTEAVYTSANGVFNDVYPVDGGKYDLVVVNKRTGALVRKTVGGFNKLRRLSASELQTMLNMSSSQLERLFFFYFDHDKLRIECASIPEGVDAPTSVGAILDGKVANDWTLQVVGVPQYDQFNRITYFKIKITI